MNPGGDFGKRELSPALRSRFTEIWVPSLEEREDLDRILCTFLVEGLLTADDVPRKLPSLEECIANPLLCILHVSGPILDFVEWFRAQKGRSGWRLISLRDLITWCRFVKSSFLDSVRNGDQFAAGRCGATMTIREAFVEGARLTVLDGLGAGSSASEESVQDLQRDCARVIDVGAATLGAFDPVVETTETEEQLDLFALPGAPFAIKRGPLPKTDVPFAFTAPTTAKNARKLLSAMQLHRPILLEGSPGVGKTR